MNNLYLINIFEIYSDLINSNKKELNNNDLWKIFEYYTCIKLSEKYNKPFYEYDDIDPNFKELNGMTRNDTGIDCCDLINTIVQCKLRSDTLNWKECSTFFGSQNIFSNDLNETIVRWKNLIIARNDSCTLAPNLLQKQKLFIDETFNKKELITFCDNLIKNPPQYPILNNDFKLRDYQIECINLITISKNNVVISLPTGTGKNSIIIHSMKDNLKYLVLVPRIILMEQLQNEIIKYKPKMKSKIQLIGDTNKKFNDNKNITICVFNSVGLLGDHFDKFKKIYIDEAHHIDSPHIYQYDTDESKNDNVNDEDINNDEDENDEDINNDEDENNEDINDESEPKNDDTEDELKNVKSYTQIIKDLSKYNNNVYLSATIDQIEGFDYYSKDIRQMIDLKYLCDYTIHVPIFSDDPTNKQICEHLLKNYRNIIIYCNSQKEGMHINKLMNELQNNSSEYIDCKTPKIKRNDIINKYKNGKISFLVNVRILVEGFDAPITKGVCFLHLPTSKTSLIQIMGRALRLHPLKTIANIILPFSSRDDEKYIGEFLKVMAKNDNRIKKSFENKQLGGYIDIDIIEDIINNDINNALVFRYNMIYNSMSYLLNSEEIWNSKLEHIKIFIHNNNELPPKKSTLNRWFRVQEYNYGTKKYIMKNSSIYNKWTEFINSPLYKKYLYFYIEFLSYYLRLLCNRNIQINIKGLDFYKNYISYCVKLKIKYISGIKIFYNNLEKLNLANLNKKVMHGKIYIKIIPDKLYNEIINYKCIKDICIHMEKISSEIVFLNYQLKLLHNNNKIINIKGSELYKNYITYCNELKAKYTWGIKNFYANLDKLNLIHLKKTTMHGIIYIKMIPNKLYNEMFDKNYITEYVVTNE
jgi:superfamily II DNA or RNA helicase